MSCALIVGGTGMLRDACQAIALKYDRVIVAARRPQALAAILRADALTLDWNAKPEAAAVLKNSNAAPADLVVSWLHDDGLWLIEPLEALLGPGGRSIRVHSSAVGDPAHGIKTDPKPGSDISRQDVVLGWVEENHDRRWLTDAEISAGVIQALENPDRSSFIVGKVM